MFDPQQDGTGGELRFGSSAAQLAAAAWLRARGLVGGSARWTVAVALDVIDRPATPEFDRVTDTRFHVTIGPDEWGLFFCHDGRTSWIRVTDVPRVFERDDHGLLAVVPPLRDLGRLVHRLEDEHKVQFRRNHASIRTSMPDAEPTIRIWVAASI